MATETKTRPHATPPRVGELLHEGDDKPGAFSFAFVARMAAEAEARMAARAAAGIPETPRYQKLRDPASERQRLLDEAMPHEWQEMTLDTFNAYTPDLRTVSSLVGEFIEQPRGSLYLYGGVGCGKTHLAAATAMRLVERRYIVRVHRASDVASRLRRASGEGQGELEMHKDRLKNVRALVIDDFGAEHMTEFLAAEWYDILDYRYRQYAATIITSNVAPDELNQPRLASRFGDQQRGIVIGIAAHDYRALAHRPAMAAAAAAFAPASELTGPCAQCGGTGFVRLDLPVGSPDFGKAHTCPTCTGRLEATKNGGVA